MKFTDKAISACVIILLLLIVVVNHGCGKKAASSEGCPGGSLLATSDDVMTSTGICGWSDVVFNGSLVSQRGESCVQDPKFTVKDSTGTPKNNICVIFETNGLWWTDSNYGTQIVGEGSNNKITASTKEDGTITLHWTTYPLPLSSAATSTTTDGKDITPVPAAISATSGAVNLLLSAPVTVKGCLKENFGACP